MCKNHDQLHYHPVLRDIAAILSGEENHETRDLLLSYATASGLAWAATRLTPALSPMEIVRVRSRLEAMKAAITSAAKGRLAEHLVSVFEVPDDQPPF